MCSDKAIKVDELGTRLKKHNHPPKWLTLPLTRSQNADYADSRLQNHTFFSKPFSANTFLWSQNAAVCETPCSHIQSTSPYVLHAPETYTVVVKTGAPAVPCVPSQSKSSLRPGGPRTRWCPDLGFLKEMRWESLC